MVQYAKDVEAILSHQGDSGGEFWASEDGKIYVGNPFSTIGSLCLLHELEVPASHPAVGGGLERIRQTWREDGQIRVAPKARLYPCYTAEAARALARFAPDDELLSSTVGFLLDNAHQSGGWRCNFTRFGRGPETEIANPGATLYVLDLLRLTARESESEVVSAAVESLLAHWSSRAPCGPCHHGIGTTFLQVEYPFIRYNLFYWVYVLSYFPQVRGDDRFEEAWHELASKLDDEGNMIAEAPHRRLGRLQFCKRGEPSELATARYREIVDNCDR